MSLRETRRAWTRKVMEDAAWHLFAERGYEEVTLGEVAEAAGVGLRTVFRYFPHKDCLLDGDHETALAALRDALADVPEGASESRVLRTAAARVVGDRGRAWDPERARLVLRLAHTTPAVAGRLLAHEADRTEILASEISRRLGTGTGDLRPPVLGAAAAAAVREAIARALEESDLDPVALVDEALAPVAAALDAGPVGRPPALAK